MKVSIQPVSDASRELVVTHRLGVALAEAPWLCRSRSDIVNWPEAEVHLQRIVGHADSSETTGPSNDRQPQRSPGKRQQLHTRSRNRAA